MKNGVLSLLAVLAIAGCQTKELEGNFQDSKHFTATIEDSFIGAETKTYLDENGNVRWKQGDQVSIFAGSTVNEQYQVTDASDGKTSAGFNKVSGGGFVGGGEIDNNVAFYPYASTAEIAKSGSSYVISDISLPATQTYAENSFGNGAFPMAAVTSSTTDMHLKFKNVLGGLKLQLKGTASIASISISGNNNEILCGAAKVTVSNSSTPSINLTDATATTVTLDCGDGVQLNAETATPFVIALPPMTMEGGFTVVVTDTEGGSMEIKTTRTQTIGRSSLLKMPEVNYVGTKEIDYSSEPLTITSTGNTSIYIGKYGYVEDISLEYKKEAESWTAYAIGSTIELSDGETLQFRAGIDGNSNFSTGIQAYYTFHVNGSGSISVSGNIMSLLDKNLQRVSLNSYAFYGLFEYCSGLKDASNLQLPATSLAELCYYGMFYGCSNLTVAPDLPAISLANNCYQNMFVECSNLVNAPALPATSLAPQCYAGMFRKCTNLTSAPTLPATTLFDYCYADMFTKCTKLTSAPELPATILAIGCYGSMFYECTSLNTAPELPATSLIEKCYDQMFYGCSNLNYVKALFSTTPSNTYTNNWLANVAASGTFVKSKDATWDVTGTSGIPSGWEVITE